MSKGGQYERDVCRALSQWWACDPNVDDWFWRASQSGGRATVRARAGKTTTGHCGDVAPCCGRAELLTKFVTFEVKRGYNSRAVLADLLDRPNWPAEDKARKRTILGFLEQAATAAALAGTPHWMLIHRRDGREPVAYVPRRLNKVLESLGDNLLIEPHLYVEGPGHGPTHAYRFHDLLDAVPAVELRKYVRAGRR